MCIGDVCRTEIELKESEKDSFLEREQEEYEIVTRILCVLVSVCLRVCGFLVVF